jgi:hypothetical protein
MADDADSDASVPGGSARGQRSSTSTGVHPRTRPPPAPNETRVLPTRQAKSTGALGRLTPGGRLARQDSSGPPDVGGRQGGRGIPPHTPVRADATPTHPSTSQDTQLSESILSDDDQGGSQGSATAFDESQVGVAGLLTRVNRKFEDQLLTMQESLQETLSEWITGVADVMASTAAEFKMTLAGISAQSSSLSNTLANIDSNLTTIDSNLTTLGAVLRKLYDKLNQGDMRATIAPAPTPTRDNVIPVEPDTTDPSTTAQASTSPVPAPDAMSGTSAFASGASVTPGGDLPRVDYDANPTPHASTGTHAHMMTSPPDATAASGLSYLVQEREFANDPTTLSAAAWQHSQDVRSTMLAANTTSRTTVNSAPPSRLPGDHPRSRHALGTTVPFYTQTLLPDVMRPTQHVTTSVPYELSDHRPTPITTEPNGDPQTWLGGMIQSPRYIDCRRQMATQKIHASNIEMLAAIEYHGGDLGRSVIDMPFVHSCGYRSSISDSDVIAAYGEIILLHASTMERWENVRTQQWGPQLERIIEKGLPTLPRLSLLAMEDIIKFYDKLQPISALYLLPIVPFDCINVNMGYEALCPPGLGIRRYARIGRVMIEVLPRILPKLHSQVNTIIAMVRQESNNGHDLLWRILELGVPGFDPSVPIRVPVWKNDDIFDFAAAFCLYYRLLAKKGLLYDDRSCSVTFLQAITAPAYVDAANTILINVHNFYSLEFDATLPPALCIMGIANQLHEQAVKRAAAVVPRARRLAYAQDDIYDLPPDYASASRMDGGRRWSDQAASTDRQPRFERGYRDDARPDRNDRGRDGPIGKGHGGSRPVVQGSRGPPRHPSSRGRYVRPDRNRGAFLPDTICDACRRPGHVAATCDVLAMALFIEKYKRDISGDLKDKLERDWIARWKDTVGSHRPPRRVMKTYVDHIDISVDELDDLLCWDCWPDDDHSSEEADDGPAGSA